MKSPFAIALIQEAVSIEIDMEIDIDPKLEKRKRIVKRLVRSKRPTLESSISSNLNDDNKKMKTHMYLDSAGLLMVYHKKPFRVRFDSV